MNEAPGRLARHQDQLAPLFQENIRRPKDQAFARPMGDAAPVCPWSREDDHSVELCAAAGERRVHALVRVFCGLSGNLQFSDFLVDNLLGVGAEHEVQFVAAPSR